MKCFVIQSSYSWYSSEEKVDHKICRNIKKRRKNNGRRCHGNEWLHVGLCDLPVKLAVHALNEFGITGQNKEESCYESTLKRVYPCPSLWRHLSSAIIIIELNTRTYTHYIYRESFLLCVSSSHPLSLFYFDHNVTVLV